MLILTAADQSAQPDFVALAMVLVLALAVAVMVIRKRMAKAEPVSASAPTEAPEAPQAPAAPGSAGQVKLHGVEPKTAAMLMAIVAHKMGKPLNELRFISIKEVP